MRFFIFIYLFLLVCTKAGCSTDSAMMIRATEYDLRSGQKPVFSHGRLDSILQQLSVVHAVNLPSEYRTVANLSAHPELNYNQYYAIRGEAVFQYIAGHFRIMDFMSKDTFFYMNLQSLPEGNTQYWLMNSRVLHKMLDLLLWMHKNGYNDSAIVIKNGHRHPAYNKKIGGVSRSYHMQGIAIDIKVGDINRSGTADSTDKKILLDYMENTLIGNSGGLGLYPGTDIIHFDVRGHRARWNSH